MADGRIGKGSRGLRTALPIGYVLDLSQWMAEVQTLQKSPRDILHKF